MGRWSWSNRAEADYLKKVEIWWLKQYGYLNGWKSGGMQWKNNNSSIGFTVSTSEGYSSIRFFYAQTEEDGSKRDFNYEAQLVTTPCNYGGKRYWFICPLLKGGVPCQRRVGVLYKCGDYFGCRHCHDLTYSSQRENRKSLGYFLFRPLTIYAKSDKLREKMKRTHYAGKPTRKFRRLLKLYQGVEPYVEKLREEEENGKL